MCSDFRLIFYIPFGAWWFHHTARSSPDLTSFRIALLAITSIAAIKALYVAFLVPPATGIIYEFQAYNSINPQFLGRRTILLGGDGLFPLLVGPALLLLLHSRNRRHIALGAICLLFTTGALVVSFTRTNWLVGFGSGALAVVLAKRNRLVRNTSIMRGAILACVGISCLFVLSSVPNSDSGFSILELIERRVSGNERLGGGLKGLTDFRVAESERLIERLKPNWLIGAGLGATYTTFTSPGVWGDTTWSHNGWLWLALKFGILGLGILLGCIFSSIRTLLSVVRNLGLAEAENAFLFLGCLIGVSVLSLTINRISYLEGSIFVGYSIGASIRAKTVLRNAIRMRRGVPLCAWAVTDLGSALPGSPSALRRNGEPEVREHAN